MEEINYYKYIKYKYKYLLLNNDKQIGGTIEELNKINDELKYYNECNNVSNCLGKIDELNKLKKISESKIKILNKQKNDIIKKFNQIITNLNTNYRIINNDIKQYQKIANQKIINPKLITKKYYNLKTSFAKLKKIDQQNIINNLEKIDHLINDKTKYTKLSKDFNTLFSKLNEILEPQTIKKIESEIESEIAEFNRQEKLKVQKAAELKAKKEHDIAERKARQALAVRQQVLAAQAKAQQAKAQQQAKAEQAKAQQQAQALAAQQAKAQQQAQVLAAQQAKAQQAKAQQQAQALATQQAKAQQQAQALAAQQAKVQQQAQALTVQQAKAQQQAQALAVQQAKAQQQAQALAAQQATARQDKKLQSQTKALSEYVGITNNGNECFFNSVLQLMYQLKDFNNELRNFGNFNIASTYVSFLDEYNRAISNNTKSIEAKDIKYQVFNKDKRRNHKTQEDAYEYLGYLLNDILKSIYSIEGIHPPKDNITNLINIEYNYIDQSLICDTKKNNSTDTFQMLILPINDFIYENGITFNSYLELLSSEEINKLCETCNSNHDFLRQIKYVFNKYVLIIMKIYDHSNNKIIVNLDKLMTEQITLNDKQYNLIGFIVHIGNNPRSGHYMSYTKKHDKWIKYDDNITTVINDINDIKSDESKYIYLYERID